MAKAIIPPTTEEVKNGLFAANDSMRMAFSFFIWQFHFKPRGDLTEETAENAKWMNYAAVCASLVNIRALNEFFRLPDAEHRLRLGDINASHYGFPGAAAFLSEDELIEVHRMAVHITVDRTYALGGRWDLREIVLRAFSVFEGFLLYLRSGQFNGQPAFESFIDRNLSMYRGWLDEWKNNGVYTEEWKNQQAYP